MQFHELRGAIRGLVAASFVAGIVAGCDSDPTNPALSSNPESLAVFAASPPNSADEIHPGVLVVCVEADGGIHQFSVPLVYHPTVRTLGTHFRLAAGECAIAARNHHEQPGLAVVRRWENGHHHLRVAEVFHPGENGEVSVETHENHFVPATISANAGAHIVFHLERVQNQHHH
jgi:hypothetical protein